MIIGVIIPTRGDRPVFLHQARYLISNQTIQPNYIEVIDHPANGNEIDVAERYRMGFEILFKKGCDIVFCWEDDDWYSPIYIEVMLNKWLIFKKPDLFGIGSTFYYHAVSKRYLEIFHPKKSSMFCTVVTKKVLELDFTQSNQYLDDFLWRKMQGKITGITYLIPRGNKPICLGIKHGSTIVAGGAHEPDSQYYNKHDLNYDFLRNTTGPDFDFYSKTLFALKYTKVSLSEKKDPFLTIITRCYKRPIGFSNNQKSIKELTDKDGEQIFISDQEGVGLFEANKSFGFVNNIIKGKYVFLLDDDDFITNPNMISDLKKISAEHDPDVIFFRMTIKNNQNGNYYPTTEQCWGNKPIIARIGGSCFVIKKEIYKKFIYHFAKPRCGDFYFIDAVFNSGAKVYWLDVKMCETGKVSRGKPE